MHVKLLSHLIQGRLLDLCFKLVILKSDGLFDIMDLQSSGVHGLQEMLST